MHNIDTDRDNRVGMSELTGYIADPFRISYGDPAELISRMDQDFEKAAEFVRGAVQARNESDT